MVQLSQEIRNAVYALNAQNSSVGQRFLERLADGSLTRVENDRSHFCVYFLPFNPKTKQIFLVHHKKARLWLSPGGHIEKDEGFRQALNREIKEELGVENFFIAPMRPFLLTIKPIEENGVRPCREHLDIWFLMKTDGGNFSVDPEEFFDARWVSFDEAAQLITDPPNLAALKIIIDYGNVRVLK